MSHRANVKSRKRRESSDSQFDFLALEKREMFALVGLQVYGSKLALYSNDAPTNIELRVSGENLHVHDKSANRVWDFDAGLVSQVVFFGGRGNDRFVNNVYELRTTAYGNAGNDYLEGFAAVDRFFGGSGNDRLLGYGGNDVLEGGAGNDYLFGHGGDDVLYGDGGADRIYGGTGSDSLLGGVGDRDQLHGGAGADRFLNAEHQERRSYYKSFWHRWRGRRSFYTVNILDQIKDASKEDAIINFKNSGRTTSRLVGFGNVQFAEGNWSDAEIKEIDVAFGNVHRHVRNTRLLKTASGGQLTFRRVGNQLTRLPGNSKIGGWNGGNEIALTSTTMQDSAWGFESAEIRRTVYHELGHNWDDPSENRFSSSFRAISKWRRGHSTGFTASLAAGDRWYYHDSQDDFARRYDAKLGGSYSTWNPQEDYATTWETYFNYYYHGSTAGNNVVASKFANLDRFFAAIRI